GARRGRQRDTVVRVHAQTRDRAAGGRDLELVQRAAVLAVEQEYGDPGLVGGTARAHRDEDVPVLGRHRVRELLQVVTAPPFDGIPVRRVHRDDGGGARVVVVVVVGAAPHRRRPSAGDQGPVREERRRGVGDVVDRGRPPLGAVGGGVGVQCA